MEGITERIDVGVGINASCWMASFGSIDSLNSKSSIYIESLFISFVGGIVAAIICSKESNSSDHELCYVFFSIQRSGCSTNVEDITVTISRLSCTVLEGSFQISFCLIWTFF